MNLAESRPGEKPTGHRRHRAPRTQPATSPLLPRRILPLNLPVRLPHCHFASGFPTLLYRWTTKPPCIGRFLPTHPYSNHTYTRKRFFRRHRRHFTSTSNLRSLLPPLSLDVGRPGTPATFLQCKVRSTPPFGHLPNSTPTALS